MASSLFLLAAALAAPAWSSVPTLAPQDLHPGQKAVVKTVFEGVRVEDFEAEIVGVLKGGRAEGDMILARATSERVVRSGVAQGMSGSPVYVEGRLIGALSSGWSFSREPLFGVTPIGEMLAVLDLPSRPDAEGSAGPSGIESASGDVQFGEFRWDEPGGRPIPAVPPVNHGPTPLGVPLVCGGLRPAALEVTRRLFEPLGFFVTPGGRDPAGGPPADSLRPGSAVAVDVLTGDLQLAAIGTLTWRDGDRVLIFGHPLFQSGNVKLPLATAEITTIVASDLMSFKLGVRGRPVGTLTQDRRASMAGRVGASPHLLPVVVEIVSSGGRRQTFHFASIEDRALAPQLVGVAALNSLLESGGTGANQTLRWTLRMTRRGAAPLTVSDAVAGEAPVADLLSAVAAPLRFLLNNPFATLKLDSVTVTIAAAPSRESWTLRSARVLDAAVRPGGAMRIECEVERWHGDRSIVSTTLTVPEEVPDGRYVLWLGGGAELSRYEASRLPGRYRPTSLDDAWRRLAGIRPGDALYATLLAGAPEVTREGRDYPELPISALALLAGTQRTGDGGRRGDVAILDERRVPFHGPVRGELLLSVQVDAKAP